MKPEIHLVAAVSRLLDLHDSRRERGTETKFIPPQRASFKNAAHHLSLGLAILEVFETLEQSEGDWFQPKSRIIREVQRLHPASEEVDIDFCMRVLCGGREIHYLSEDGSKPLFTQETTTLVERAVGEYAQFRLTENARLLSRVRGLKNRWIYEDQDTEKIIRAVEDGFFEDVPRFCRERIASILSLSKAITRAEERSSDDAVKEFLTTYGESKNAVEKSLEVIKKGMALLRSDIIRERFEEWQERTGNIDMSLGNIMSDLEAVAQLLEKVTRRLAHFIVGIQTLRSATIGVVPFRDIAEGIITSPPSLEVLSAFLSKMGPWAQSSIFFSPLDFTDSIELIESTEEKSSAAKQIDLENMVDESGDERVWEFLIRNRDWIIARLRKSPLSFADVLQIDEFVLDPGETPADFYGVYAIPDEFGEDIHVFVGTDGGKLNYRAGGVSMRGDNPTLFLGNLEG